MWHPSDPLQTESASRKLWLVKVRSMGQSWGATCPHPSDGFRHPALLATLPASGPQFCGQALEGMLRSKRGTGGGHGAQAGHATAGAGGGRGGRKQDAVSAAARWCGARALAGGVMKQLWAVCELMVGSRGSRVVAARRPHVSRDPPHVLACCHAARPSPAASVGQGIPQEFVMKNTTKFADPMLAFSDKGGQLGACTNLGRLHAGGLGPAAAPFPWPLPQPTSCAPAAPSIRCHCFPCRPCSCGGQGVAEV